MNEMTPPPHSPEMEKSILSSILKDPVEYIPRAIELGLTPERFYIPGHARFYDIMLRKYQKGDVFEFETLMMELDESGDIELVGGRTGVAEFYTYAPTGAHFDSHAEKVMEKSQLRSVIRFGTEIISRAYENEDIGDLIPKIELGALSIGQDAESKNSYNYSLKSAYKELTDILQSKDTPGIPTGFREIDRITGGLHAGEVTVVAARPAMGKTAFAISLAESLALQNEVATALFVVEGRRSYLTTRLMAVTAHISAKRIRDKQITEGDKQKIGRRINATKDCPLFMDDRIASAVEMSARIRRIHQKTPLKVVIVDYIQKLPAAIPEERSNLRLRIINATDVLHQTCKALDISLVLLAQLGRDSANDNPDMNALKESGSLEQDADTIILLGSKGEQPDDVNAPIEKLIRIPKNRHGPCADLTMTFNPPTTRFY